MHCRGTGLLLGFLVSNLRGSNKLSSPKELQHVFERPLDTHGKKNSAACRVRPVHITASPSTSMPTKGAAELSFIAQARVPG